MGRTTKMIGDAFWASQKEFSKIATPFFETDDTGFVKKDDAGKHVLKEGVSEEQVKEAMEKFLSTTVEIDRWKLKLEDLEPAKLSPVDFIALEPILEDR